ncbi:MAG TPA: ATP-binding protein [Candidatus Dormibacteraeota bacterium]|nr:ATP-binding protein [Candidatus Dormibacteraeota bacterium]
MIVADRREGGIQPEADRRSAYAPLWRNLDRNVPLGPKLIVPVILVTLLGTGGFGFGEAVRTNNAVEATYVASATADARAAANAFYSTISDPPAVDQYLADLASAEPNIRGIWIVNLVLPGSPVVASSVPTDISDNHLVDKHEIEQVEAGQITQETETIAGEPMLETIVPVKGNAYAVVVETSLKAESETLTTTLISAAVVALIICLLEVAAMGMILETGVLRRIRRVGKAVDEFGRGARHARLSEGSEPEGRDALFNLARNMDHKLSELSERERAGTVVSELGLLALQGALPSDLTIKALDITRQAGDLERCFLVDTSGAVTIVGSSGGGAETTEAKLPIWLGALVRSATQARRPILADGFGQDCRYWEAGSANVTAAAAFVPLAGTPNPIGVMVGVARSGGQISPVTVSMMEAVATALGESLQRSEAEKARHESEAKSKALSTVSHEMRNPLNAMLGFSNLLLTGAAGQLNEKQQNYVHRVDEASHHLLRLVNDYLDLARVMNGSLPVQPEAVVVGPEVQSVLELLGPTAEAKNVSLHSEVPPEATALADRLRLRQVLMNLVSNAIKFTPARGHVRVEVAGGSNGVRISVIDTGVGIPADRQHLVFTEFAQLRPEGRSEGSGLGLALTKRFVEAMGGFIRFTSSEGAGTIFDVWLPGEQSPRHGADPAKADERAAGAA